MSAASESKHPRVDVHMWDICPGSICTGTSGFDENVFGGKFKANNDPKQFSAWSWDQPVNPCWGEIFDEMGLPDHGKGYGVLNLLYKDNEEVLMVAVFPNQEQEVAEWLRPKFPYPASVVCPPREKNVNRSSNAIFFTAVTKLSTARNICSSNTYPKITGVEYSRLEFFDFRG